MNIFVLDLNPELCAQYHCDKHLVKMILESAQMLSTVCRKSGLLVGYKATHKNHPCTLWAGESLSNWKWLKQLAKELNREWQFRYSHPPGKNHKSWEMIEKLPEPKIDDKGITDFVQAMNSDYRVQGDPVKAYRNYYRNGKRHLLWWTRRTVPFWLYEEGENHG